MRLSVDEIKRYARSVLLFFYAGIYDINTTIRGLEAVGVYGFTDQPIYAKGIRQDGFILEGGGVLIAHSNSITCRYESSVMGFRVSEQIVHLERIGVSEIRSLRQSFERKKLYGDLV